ncbi:hypothetical protein DKG79_02640 [Escherichia fergusonii]|nr:hypothetical protein DKG79_02640 [Escherichia fergusonii]
MLSRESGLFSAKNHKKGLLLACIFYLSKINDIIPACLKAILKNIGKFLFSLLNKNVFMNASYFGIIFLY